MLTTIKSHLDTKLWIVILLIGLILCFMGNQVFLKSLFVFGFLALALPGYLVGNQTYGLPGGTIWSVCRRHSRRHTIYKPLSGWPVYAGIACGGSYRIDSER